ncbi:hypothetical protein PAEPH01_0752 [Pancytospora epiphaga]|nr:hypothetical protein PAEPH01_0752 [Pancytospora epiphaga]
MRVLSFNVNGLRSFSKKIGDISFNDYLLNVLNADILCVQEIKGSRDNLASFHFLKDYRTFSSFHPTPGRHGVSTFVRKSLFCNKSVELLQGRILKTVHGNILIYNCYLPFLNATEATEKEAYDVYRVYDILSKDLPELSVIFCGDLNACYSMLDHYQYAKEVSRIVASKGLRIDGFTFNILPNDSILELLKQRGALKDFYKEELDGIFNNSLCSSTCKIQECIIKEIDQSKYIERVDSSPRELPYTFFDIETIQKYFYGQYQRVWLLKMSKTYLDTFRIFNNDIKKYTCWNTFLNNRPINLGTRIDYIFCSKDVVCTASGILSEIVGSDHCPVFADFEMVIEGKKEDNILLKENNLLRFLVKK